MELEWEGVEGSRGSSVQRLWLGSKQNRSDSLLPIARRVHPLSFLASWRPACLLLPFSYSDHNILEQEDTREMVYSNPLALQLGRSDTKRVVTFSKACSASPTGSRVGPCSSPARSVFSLLHPGSHQSRKLTVAPQ